MYRLISYVYTGQGTLMLAVFHFRPKKSIVRFSCFFLACAQCSLLLESNKVNEALCFWAHGLSACSLFTIWRNYVSCCCCCTTSRAQRLAFLLFHINYSAPGVLPHSSCNRLTAQVDDLLPARRDVDGLLEAEEGKSFFFFFPPT